MRPSEWPSGAVEGLISKTELQIEGLDPLPTHRALLSLVWWEEAWEKPGTQTRPSHHLEMTGVKGNGRHRCSCTKYRTRRAAYLPLQDTP